MSESWITYQISRPYPCRWLTPVVAVGATIALVLFSVLNFASSGYTLVSEYSTNPNSTTQHWFDKWPSSLRSKIRPTCPPSAIPLNSRLYTNNTALQYDLTSVRPLSSGIVSLPSLIYSNNPLEECGIQSIQMTFEVLGRTANQMAVAAWGLDIQGLINCKVYGPNGAVNITLNTNYNFLPSTMSTYGGQYEFPGRNATHSPSLWWGESLLSHLYLQTIKNLTEAAGDQNKLSLYLTPNKSVTRNLKEQDYFTVLERDMTLYPNSGTRMNPSSTDPYETHDQITQFSDPFTSGLNAIIVRIGWIRPENSTLSNLIAKTTGPNIWPIVDMLAKSFESTILTDLGQVNAKPNVLVDPELLQQYTSKFATWAGIGDDIWHGVPAIDNYESLRHTTGPLAVNPSTLAINYLCQIPKRKPLADLIISVLVANLVFLQALWLIFTFGMGYWLKRKDERSEYCIGCVGRMGHVQEASEPARYQKVNTHVEIRSDY